MMAPMRMIALPGLDRPARPVRRRRARADRTPVQGFSLLPSHICRICHRRLSTPESVAAGIGPVCAARLRARDRAEADAGHDRCDLPFDPVSGDIVCRRDPDGTIHTNVPHQVVRHSPDGYEWGYGGAGPAEFALNILRLFTIPEIADALYQEFKQEVIAALPHEGGVIRGAQIRAWIADRCISLDSVDAEHHGRLWAVQASGIREFPGGDGRRWVRLDTNHGVFWVRRDQA